MSFRRKNDGWSKFCREHRKDLDYTGIPEEVWRDRLRFMVFLDHGYDEFGWAASPHSFFDSTSLSDDQVQRLVTVCAEVVDEPTLRMVRSRWGRCPLPEDKDSV